jgi:DNA helicase-2/ATP-dependent DNA helicase PcrA
MDPFAQLNPQQRQAVNSIEGPLLVLAGAGSGKTRVVTLRIVNMLNSGIPARNILGLTFTNKAAAEMRQRVHALTQYDVLISTFHSLGARMLRESITVLGYGKNFTIYDDDDTTKLLQICSKEAGLGDEKKSIKNLSNYVSAISNHRIPSEDNSLYRHAYDLYRQKLKEYNAVDFDDLLLLPVKILREFPDIRQHYQELWRYLLIDEYQDTNESQYQLIKYLTEKSHNICVVGDPDQSIYAWRGANMENIIHFEIDYPTAFVVQLEQNYRSPNTILEVANALILNNPRRHDKKLWSDLGKGETVKHFTASSDREEATFVADKLKHHHQENQFDWKEMVIFYRTHAQSRAFEDQFYLHRIPYMIIGGVSFYQRREVKDILAYLQMVQSDNNYIAFNRTINMPKRGLGKTTIDKLVQGASEEGMPLLTYCAAIVRGDSFSSAPKFSAKQKSALKDYLEIVYRLRKESETVSLSQLVMLAIETSNYYSYLEEDKETYTERKENIKELVNKSAEWEKLSDDPSLTGFLEELSLRSNIDDAEEVINKVHLMSIHNGKGLEYEVVFLVGLEEELFPHINSLMDEGQIEEERRLCYVGMTRAKEILYLTHAKYRFIWGTQRHQTPSRFLAELPNELIDEVRKISYSEGYPQERKKARPALDFRSNVSVNEALPDLKVGDLVTHAMFGVGTLLGIENGHLGLTYKVHFAKDNKDCTLIAKMAKLQKL